MKRENKNFIVNVAYQCLIPAFPLITVPYTSRVLGVESIGIYSYTYSIVNLFMLIAMLGISNHGNRSVAQSRDDKEQLSRTFSTVYTIQLSCCGIATLGYIVYMALFSGQYFMIAVLQLPFLISVCFDISWLFFGMEQFLFPLTRNLIVKLASLLLMILLVKKPDDLWIYTLVMSGSTFASNILLVVAAPRYVRYVRPTIADMKPHIKPILVLFVPVLAFSIYNVMDKTMLGSIATVTELGYYENAEKINTVPTAVVSALGTVMLPRMANLLKDRTVDYKKPIAASMKLALILSTTMCFGLLLIGNDAAIVLFGSNFERSGPLIQLLAVTVIANAWSNVVRTQYLIPLKLDSIYVQSTFGAGVINFVINIILIPHLGAIGACIGTIAAEYFIAIFQTVATFHQLESVAYLKTLLTCLIKAVIIFAVTYAITFRFDDLVIRFCLEIIVFFVLAVMFYWRYLKNDFFGRGKVQR